MEFMEVIRKRRSIRKFKPEPVPDELIMELLEAARLAPSGTNLQPWRFIIIKSEEKRRELLGHTVNFVVTAPVVIACCVDLNTYKQHKPQRIKELTRAGAFSGVDLNFNDGDKYWKQRGALNANEIREYVSINCAVAVQQLVLRATDLGLGTCWVMMFDQDSVKKILGLGADIDVLALIPVGYADQDPAPRPRLPVRELLIKELK
ncbi:putative NAD(P)H nitroreductase [Sporotomaculum syntrophicum]|uniref:NAD(P)H nitroreductase n=1 Tax=Sporotomaculum syntrophicum TaxID=182264 RepID=A0A9D2WQW2_9FIRM|nr:nitroreductase family protein [Sporotomaculum syntrophicum]KAF1085428.1 putative NAD(P)H nitroreductase [Sporotomaculum syntrophicum]